MIIVEGPDGSGKTTLASRLCAEFDLEYRKPPKEALDSTKGPQGHEERLLIQWWLRQLKEDLSLQRKIVYDRTTFISDVIYRLAAGHPPQGNEREMARGIQHLCVGGLIIFCLPKWEVARESIFKAGRPKLKGVDEERLQNIHWAYECQFHLYKEAAFERVLRYEWDNLDRIMAEVEEYAHG